VWKDSQRGNSAVAALRCAMRRLPSRERMAVELIHGLNGDGPISFRNLASRLPSVVRGKECASLQGVINIYDRAIERLGKTFGRPEFVEEHGL